MYLARNLKSTLSPTLHQPLLLFFKKGTLIVKRRLLMLSTQRDIPNSSNNVALHGHKTLDNLTFSNRCLNSLPIDPVEENYTRKVHDSCFSKVYPSPVINPILASFSPLALSLIDLGKNETEKPDFAEYLSGNKILNGSLPFAHCYCGHQFGSFAGQLGDGAAIYLGEIRNNKGEFWELQLKGAGKTPYSRNADGRKVLRSSIREFLCSEHMYALGVPTTRAATLVSSDSLVPRDMFYDGHTKNEKCAVVSRFSPTFIRFGSFEIFKAKDSKTNQEGPSVGNFKLQQELLHFVINNYYPEAQNLNAPAISIEDELKSGVIKEFLRQVIHKTAKLVAKWQCIGWCHGVLNTDNLSILGLTIDYGPFEFMEHYTPYLISNTTDELGRYRFEAQPNACKWNCWKLCEMISPLICLEDCQTILDEFDVIYNQEYSRTMKEKLGLIGTINLQNIKVMNNLLEVMEETGADWTNTFRDLNLMKVNLFQKQHAPNETEIIEIYIDVLDAIMKFLPSLEQIQDLVRPNITPIAFHQYSLLWESQPELMLSFGVDENFLKRIKKQQERYIWLQKTSPIEKLESDSKQIHEWLKFYTLNLYEDFLEFPGSSDQYMATRKNIMDKANPRIILRNHLAQKAIKNAEKNDFNELNRLLSALLRPYDEGHNAADLQPLGGRDNARLKLS